MTKNFPTAMDSIVYKNVLSWRGCEKLYLNNRTKDVSLIFRSDGNGDIEKVPAHKNILSAISPVFDAMFYGPNKQDGDIEIVDASPGAFKEFLQFFYRSQVKLTAENAPDVMDLCKRYLLDDWETISVACTDVCKATLTLDTMCWGYEMAILFELDDLKAFCAEKIGKNAVEVFRSSSFLNCQPNLLRYILKLDTLNCGEIEVFNGCVAWAKAECSRKGCNANNAQNIRTQLGDLFNEIRFGEMTHKEFQYINRTYDGLFSAEEFRDITMKITDQEGQAENAKCRQHVVQNTSVNSTGSAELVRIEPEIELFCKRTTDHLLPRKRCIEASCFETTFMSTSQLLLKSVSLSSDFEKCSQIDVSIYENSTENNGGILIAFESKRKYPNFCHYVVRLSTPILIKANIRYRFDISVPFDRYEFSFRSPKTVRMEDGTLIGFNDDNSYITFLRFVKCKKEQ